MALRHLDSELAQLRSRGLYRDPTIDRRALVTAQASALGLPLLDASSNDYLGLLDAETSRELHQIPGQPGAGASRLIHGTRPAHEKLERELAEWLGTESALLFTSGYAANVGVISALAGPNDQIFSDSLNHASLIDGCRLSRAETVVYPHNNLSQLARLFEQPCRGRRWLVTESYFSMDADSPDLPALQRICETHNIALVLDEAHALGVFGPAGTGLAAAAAVQPEVLVGTFGKAFGAQGAFVAGSSNLTAWLFNRARSFVFSTAPSPLLSAIISGQLRSLRQADAKRQRLREVLPRVTAAVAAHATLNLPEGQHGPVVPILCGSTERAGAVAQHFWQQGILAQPIRPPTVPVGAARVRLTVRANFSDTDISRLCEAISGA